MSLSGTEYIFAMNANTPALTDEYLRKCEDDAREYHRSYDMTPIGTMAAHVIRLLRELRRVKNESSRAAG